MLNSHVPNQNQDIPGTVEVELVKNGQRVRDRLAIEEPLEIRLNNMPLAILMRTPATGAESDLDLVAGFLVSEGIVDGKDDLVGLGHCTDPNSEHAHNRVIVHLASGLSDAKKRFSNAQRHLFVSGSCGVCGKATIEQLMQKHPRLSRSLRLDSNLIGSLSEKLSAEQRAFRVTGGLHGAALFDKEGVLLCAAEDIGRHNAVDKVIGHRFRQGYFPLEDTILMVSSRAGFEIVQKAIAAQIGALVTVGSASSLAHDLATEAGLNLYSFVRSDRFNHHPDLNERS